MAGLSAESSASAAAAGPCARPLGLSLPALRALVAPLDGGSPASLRAACGVGETPIAALTQREAGERVALRATREVGGSFAALLLKEDEEFTRAGGEPRAAPATVVAAAAEGATLGDIAEALQAHFKARSGVAACVPPLCFDLHGMPSADDAARDAWLAEALVRALSSGGGGAGQQPPALVLVLPPPGTRGTGAPPLSSAPCVVACAAALRRGATPEVALSDAVRRELHAALLRGSATRSADFLGDAAGTVGPGAPLRALLEATHPGWRADVARWSENWLLAQWQDALADLRQRGAGASIEAAHCMRHLGAALAAEARAPSAAERAEAVSLLRAALLIFCAAPATTGASVQAAVGACLEALEHALSGGGRKSAADAGDQTALTVQNRSDAAQINAPPMARRAAVARAMASAALLLALCVDAALLMAARGARVDAQGQLTLTMPPMLLRAGPDAVTQAASVVLALHAVVACAALALLATLPAAGNATERRRAAPAMQSGGKAALPPAPVAPQALRDAGFKTPLPARSGDDAAAKATQPATASSPAAAARNGAPMTPPPASRLLSRDAPSVAAAPVTPGGFVARPAVDKVPPQKGLASPSPVVIRTIRSVKL